MTEFFRNKFRQLSSSQFIILGFLLVILLGSLVLMLPFSTKDGGGASFFDALFTATSAVCVTGLIVRDTATYWSGFGQAVILILIQIGGMGVVTVAIATLAFAGKKVGLKNRFTMQEAISAPHVAGIVKLVRFILGGVFLIEFVGAVLFSTVFIREFGLLKGLWYSVFHSISAFCNAGFDLMGIKEEFSSLTTFQYDIVVNITTMLLIIIGGLGFLTWADLKEHKFRFKKYSLQTKIVLVVTLILLFFPSLYFFFVELTGIEDFGSRLLAALFQAVTARTAGFNTVDFSLFSEAGILIFILLMLVGGSPGSTAGGMKTTTLAVLVSSSFSVFRRDESIHFFGRRLPEETLSLSSAILTMYLSLFLTGGMIISLIERVPLLTALFETGSAIGTVGVTMGLTPSLSLISRFIIIALMFFGRVGGLTLIYAALSEKKKTGSKYPEEKLTVG